MLDRAFFRNLGVLAGVVILEVILVEGVFDASEVMNITIELVKRGYNEDQIAKIWGGNLIRVFSEVQTIARKIKSDTSL